MTETNGNGNGRQIASVMTGLYRGLSIALIGLLGWFASQMLTDIKTAVIGTQAKVEALDNVIGQEQVNRTDLQGQVRVNGVKNEEQDRRLTKAEDRIDDHDRRLNRIGPPRFGVPASPSP